MNHICMLILITYESTVLKRAEDDSAWLPRVLCLSLDLSSLATRASVPLSGGQIIFFLGQVCIYTRGDKDVVYGNWSFS